jgi:hypothetical protein
MKHLKALADAGLTDVHLLPAFDIATIDENKAAREEPVVPAAAPDSAEQQAAVMAKADKDGFNWGYDPYHYTVPEGSYSTDPNGARRIVAQRAALSDLVALSTLNVTVDPRSEAAVWTPPGFVSGLESGWNALRTVTAGLVTLLGFLLPFLGVLAVLAVPIVVFIFLLRRRK